MTTTIDTCAGIEAEIADRRAQQDRMPDHWHERRETLGDEIDALVDRWLAACG